MEESAMNIQWYPGHMTKTRRMISDQLKHMDAVCEILDAGSPSPAGIRTWRSSQAASRG